MHSHEVMAYTRHTKLQDIKIHFEQIFFKIQHLYFDYLWTYRNKTTYSGMLVSKKTNFVEISGMLVTIPKQKDFLKSRERFLR